MEQRSPGSKNRLVLPVALAVGLVALLALTSVFLLGSKSDNGQAPATPTAQSVVAAAATATPAADLTETASSLQTPSPYVVQKLSDAEDNPVPVETPAIDMPLEDATATAASVEPMATAAAPNPTRPTTS